MLSQEEQGSLARAADALLAEGLVVTEFGDLRTEQMENLAAVAGRVVGATLLHQSHAARRGFPLSTCGPGYLGSAQRDRALGEPRTHGRSVGSRIE